MRVFLRLIAQGLHDLTLNPWAQLLTLTAVILVNFIVGLFLMGITTLDHQLNSVRGETVFQVYWHTGVNQKVIDEQWKTISQLPGFHHAKTYTPAQALKELEERIGRSASSKNFPFLNENNPLPATALLSFTAQDPANMEEWLDKTTRYLQKLPGVERVAATPLRDELGQAWRKMNSYVMRPAILFLTMLLGLMVGNTIRLALLSKAQEVEILLLVGAFNWYIRLPLLVCGAIHGFFGSAMALIMLRFIHLNIQNVFNFPPLLMQIQFMPLGVIMLMLLMSTGMGFLGSWIGIKR